MIHNCESFGRKSLVRKSKILPIILTLCLLFSFLQPTTAETRLTHARAVFSSKVDQSLKLSANALNKSITSLVTRLNATPALNVKLNSHFYDANIRRFFVSISGNGIFKGKLPKKLQAGEYFVSCEKEVTYDFYFSEVKFENGCIRFKFDGTIVFSLDRIAYQLMKAVPDLAAAGVLSPAGDLLTEILQKLDIGVLSEAISHTLTSFSNVTVARVGADLLSAAGNNRNLKIVIKKAMNDGSALSFLGLAILKCAIGSLVKVTGASMGSAVGSILVPGMGTVVGAFFGSQVASIAASTIVYHVSMKIPVKRDMKRMLNSYLILKRFPDDKVARSDYEKALGQIQKKVFRDFNQERFRLFHLVLNEIDKLSPIERAAFVPLLKDFQEKLTFKVINDKDWYFARYYNMLKVQVEKWHLQNQVNFSTKP